MTEGDEYYWEGMEPLDDSDKFFTDLCTIIDLHSDGFDERLKYLCALEHFRQSWMETYGATGAFWHGKPEVHTTTGKDLVQRLEQAMDEEEDLEPSGNS